MSSPCRAWLPGCALLLSALCTPPPCLAHPSPGEPGAPVANPADCAQATLCTRLGGPVALDEIAGQLLQRATVDPRTRDHWQRVDLRRVRVKLGEYLCVLTGGTCAYDNDDLRTIHAGQHIRSGEFYALVEDLRAVLDARGVAEREKNELLALLAPTKRDVVEP